MSMKNPKSSNFKPLVLLPADVKPVGEHPFHAVGQKYILAVAQAADALPLLLPAISEHLDLEQVLSQIDGVLLTGAVSNVHPSHFGEDVHNSELPLDPDRDALTLKLIKAAIKAKVPLLAICRGFQELNVAYGGSLHQAVQEVAGMSNHREPKGQTIEQQYAPAHSITLVEDGFLASLLKTDQIEVNSLHGQGINQLGQGLVVEAYAPDGLIESIRVKHAEAFALGVQWHPEWRVLENPAYLSIFSAFGDACRMRQLERAAPD